MQHALAQRMGRARNQLLGNVELVGQPFVILEPVRHHEWMHSGAHRREVILVLVAANKAAGGINRMRFAQRTEGIGLFVLERDMRQESEFVDIDAVAREQVAQGFYGFVRDVSGDQADDQVGRPEQRLDQGGDARVELRLGAVHVGQGFDQFFTTLLAELALQVNREFAQPAQILEEPMPLLEAVFVAQRHTVLVERSFNCTVGIDGGAVRIENQQPFVVCVHFRRWTSKEIWMVLALHSKRQL